MRILVLSLIRSKQMSSVESDGKKVRIQSAERKSALSSKYKRARISTLLTEK